VGVEGGLGDEMEGKEMFGHGNNAYLGSATPCASTEV
jgi:hypothetical protein